MSNVLCSAVHFCTPQCMQNKVFCIPPFQHSLKFDYYATLYKSLSAWAEARSLLLQQVATADVPGTANVPGICKYRVHSPYSVPPLWRVAVRAANGIRPSMLWPKQIRTYTTWHNN